MQRVVAKRDGQERVVPIDLALALPTANEYLGLVMQFILAFGMSFLLPVLLLLLHRAGIVTRRPALGPRVDPVRGVNIGEQLPVVRVVR